MKARMLLGLGLGLVASPAFAGELAKAAAYGATWGGVATGVARGLFPLFLLIAILAELVFRDGSQPPSIRNSFMRGTIVLLLLLPLGSSPSPGGRSTTMYGFCAAQLAGIADGMTEALGPHETFEKFKTLFGGWVDDWKRMAKEEPALAGIGAVGSFVGGELFMLIVLTTIFVGQAAQWVMTQLAAILTTLLFAIGPLALVAWLPRASDSLSRWLRTYITVLTWPVLSALILQIITASNLDGLKGAQSPAFACIATAMLMAVCACSVPVIASSLVGSSMGAIGSGFSNLAAAATVGAGAAAALGSAAATGAKGAASLGSAAVSAAGRLVGSAGSGTGGESGIGSAAPTSSRQQTQALGDSVGGAEAPVASSSDEFHNPGGGHGGGPGGAPPTHSPMSPGGGGSNVAVAVIGFPSSRGGAGSAAPPRAPPRPAQGVADAEAPGFVPPKRQMDTAFVAPQERAAFEAAYDKAEPLAGPIPGSPAAAQAAERARNPRDTPPLPAFHMPLPAPPPEDPPTPQPSNYLSSAVTEPDNLGTVADVIQRYREDQAKQAAQARAQLQTNPGRRRGK